MNQADLEYDAYDLVLKLQIALKSNLGMVTLTLLCYASEAKVIPCDPTPHAESCLLV